jgi:hypothetical protein
MKYEAFSEGGSGHGVEISRIPALGLPGESVERQSFSSLAVNCAAFSEGGSEHSIVAENQNQMYDLLGNLQRPRISESSKKSDENSQISFPFY